MLAALLDGPLAGVSGGFTSRPFLSSGDRGFAPLTYTEIDPRFGSWSTSRNCQRHDVLLDLMINHISRSSPQFRDFQRRGRRSPFADLFITLDKVWPNGEPPGDVARIFLRKPNSPFSSVTIQETGEEERIWTSFGTADWSEQIDLDVTQATRALITDWLQFLSDRSVRSYVSTPLLRHQEARHDLLHGGTRRIRLPRLGDRCRPATRPRRPARGP